MTDFRKGLIAAALLVASGTATAIDWTDAPIVQDGACEFRGALWTQGFARRHGLKSTEEMQALGIRRAQERCKDGMVLLISSLHSGVGPTVEPTLNVARALCRVPDIQQTTRPSIEQYTVTDVRCTISKLGDPLAVAPSAPPPPDMKTPSK